MGLWREGSALDAADKTLSRPFFLMKLPALGEILLSVPGAFMGFPHAFLGGTPLTLAWLAGGGSGCEALGICVACSWLLGLMVFYGGFAGHFDVRTSTKFIIAGMFPLTCVVLALSGAPPAARLAGFCSLTCSTLAVTVCIPLKAVFDRLRPAVALQLIQSVQDRRSALLAPYMRAMCSSGQARDALPSSDVAVMAANAALLWRLGFHSLATLLVTLSMFGRMYFWAHHLLDAAFGGLLGILVVACMKKLHVGAQLPHAALSYAIFLVAILAMQRRMAYVSKQQQRSA